MNEIFTYRLDGNLYVNLTNKCSNACTFCIRNNGTGVGDGDDLWLSREPSAEEVIARIKAEKRDFKSLVFCGYGEPTYRVDAIAEIGKWARSEGIKTRLTTTGLGNLINGRDIVPELKGALDTISVSLNADNEDDYDKLCRSKFGKAAFNAMLDFTAECVKAGIDTVLSIVAIDGVDLEKCNLVAKKVGAKLRVREYIP